MAKLRADKKNYKKAFTIHANAYDNWNLGSDNSRRLILCYCVECGLKCLIMDNDNICTISQANEKTEEVLCTHDFRKLLKEVGSQGNFNLNSLLQNMEIQFVRQSIISYVDIILHLKI